MNIPRIAALLFFSTLLVACGTAPVTPPPEKKEPLVVAPQKPSSPMPKGPMPEPAPPVFLLLSDDIPAYREVADNLMGKLQGRARLIDMSREGQAAGTADGLSRQPGYQQYVAIGHAAAARLPALLDDDDVALFCQLFNYPDVVKLSPRSKGVSAVPSATRLFSVWRQLSPQLATVGVITGPGLETVIAQAAAEASSSGVTLQHRVVASDKEMLYAFKQLAPTIDGLWLLPDNRVLSRTLLRELMSYSMLHAMQLAVFNDELLKFGGLLSITADTAEIADKVLKRLQASRRGEGIPGVDLLPLEAGVVHINPMVAKQLNLVITDEIREALYAQ